MKLYIITALFLLFSYTVSAETVGVPTDVSEVNCVGEYIVHVKGGDPSQYELIGCWPVEDNWNCNCDNSVLQFKTNETATYDFRIQYYLDEVVPMTGNATNDSLANIENEINKIVLEVNNLEFSMPDIPEEPLEPLKVSDTIKIIGIAGVVLFFLVLLIIVVWKWVSRDEKEDKFVRKVVVKRKGEDEDEDDVEYLRKFVR